MGLTYVPMSILNEKRGFREQQHWQESFQGIVGFGRRLVSQGLVVKECRRSASLRPWTHLDQSSQHDRVVGLPRECLEREDSRRKWNGA